MAGIAWRQHPTPVPLAHRRQVAPPASVFARLLQECVGAATSQHARSLSPDHIEVPIPAAELALELYRIHTSAASGHVDKQVEQSLQSGRIAPLQFTFRPNKVQDVASPEPN